MKLALANTVRNDYITKIMEFLIENGEDVGRIGSNSCNLPFVIEEEEGVLEIVVKVVKKDYDECMQERTDYTVKVAENEEKAKKKAEDKAKKIAKDKSRREKENKTEE